MPELDRRKFLQAAGAGAGLSALTPSIARAASIPANRRAGSIDDVEHIVVLMQENRSFDHYFGTMRGVRGYGDPHPVRLRNGRTVWHQPKGKKEVLPFRPDLEDLGLAFIQDIDHEWESQHAAFAEGNYDRWLKAKGTDATMAHLRRSDLPFHYALAEAFTICDAYHCSVLGPTNPNRYYLWSGWVGNDGTGRGPIIHNTTGPAFGWKTYPERLQKAGVKWKVYQDEGSGLDAAHTWGWDITKPFIGTYGDNSLLYFQKYQDATSGSPLFDNARTGTHAAEDDPTLLFEGLAGDVAAGQLPDVSWIVAPEAFTEHPNWPAGYGAYYISQVLDALTSNEEVWSKTALFLTFDENDGFFDHVVPPYPSVGSLNGDSTVSLANEYFHGKGGAAGPYGLGVRVPMTVISPWSTGGWVCSETFDHTSVIRFMEKRFGVREPNITKWRRTVCGDLTSAFDFSKSPAPPPPPPPTPAPPPDQSRHPNNVPSTAPENQRVPKQEAGTRHSRPLGYRLNVSLDVRPHSLAFTIKNAGRLGAQLQARSDDVKGAPFSYTVAAGKQLQPELAVSGRYDVSFHGPNGFFRRFAGNTRANVLEVRAMRQDGRLVLTLRNTSNRALKVRIADAYDRDRKVRVRRHSRKRVRIGLGHTHGWYDVLVTVKGYPALSRTLAGRFDNGRPTTSDPQLGR
jgi:phospholipase C